MHAATHTHNTPCANAPRAYYMSTHPRIAPFDEAAAAARKNVPIAALPSLASLVNPVKERARSSAKPTVRAVVSSGFPDARAAPLSLGRLPNNAKAATPFGRRQATEPVDISHGNADDIIKSMSDAQIQAAVEEIQSRIAPDVLNRLLHVREQRDASSSRNDSAGEPAKHVTFAPAAATERNDLSWIANERDLERAALAQGPDERSKLEWIYDSAPELDNGDAGPRSTPSVRFDLTGQPADPASLENKLYHHGEEPSKPGYTFDELAHLSRSTLPSQRVMALRAMAGALRYRSALLATDGTAAVPEFPVSALRAARVALDIADANLVAVCAAIDALHAFVVEPGELAQRVELARLPRMHWGVAGQAQGAPSGARAREVARASRPLSNNDDDGNTKNAAEAEEDEDERPAGFLLDSLFLARALFLLSRADLPNVAVVQIVDVLEYIGRVDADAVVANEALLAALALRCTPAQSGQEPDVAVVDRVAFLLQTLAAASRDTALAVSAHLPALRSLLVSRHTAHAAACLDVWRDVMAHGIVSNHVEALAPQLTARLRDDAECTDRLFASVHYFFAQFCDVRRQGDGNASPLRVLHEAVRMAAVRAATRFDVSAVALLASYASGFAVDRLPLDWLIASLPERRAPPVERALDAELTELVECMTMAAHIFAGHALFDDEVSGLALLKLREAARALFALARVSAELEDLAVEFVDRACALAPRRGKFRRPPQSPSLGTEMLLQDDVFVDALALAAGAGLWLDAARVRAAIVTHVGSRLVLGPRGHEAQARVLISALLTATVLTGMSSREALRVRDTLLPRFNALLNGDGATTQAWCASDAHYALWQRASLAWPAILLFAGSADADSKVVAGASLRLLWECRECVGASLVRAALLAYARQAAEPEAERTLALWDWAHAACDPDAVAAWAGGREALRALLAALAEAHEERLFGHPLLARAVGFALGCHSALAPARASVLRILARGSGRVRFDVLSAEHVDGGLDEDAVKAMADALAVAPEGSALHTLCVAALARKVVSNEHAWAVALAMQGLKERNVRAHDEVMTMAL